MRSLYDGYDGNTGAIEGYPGLNPQPGLGLIGACDETAQMGRFGSAMSSRLLHFAQRVRVPAGFVLAPLIILASTPTVASMAAGSIVSLVGLGIRDRKSTRLNSSH